jgi:hypothetical protein
MNKKEIIIFTAWVGLAAVMASTTSYGKDFSVAGQTVSVGASSDLNYTTGVEDWEWELTPSAGLTAMGLGFTMATDIDMLTLDEGDIFQGLDFTVDYIVPSTNISLYTEVSTDSDLEFGDVTVGATVSF